MHCEDLAKTVTGRSQRVHVCAHFLLSGFAYDFKTNNCLMELSFKCLKDGGKYLARVSCRSRLLFQ